jgi:hypothetical protein
MAQMDGDDEARPSTDQLAGPGMRGNSEMVIERVRCLLIRIGEELLLDELRRIRRQLGKRIEVPLKSCRIAAHRLLDQLAAHMRIHNQLVFNDLSVNAFPLLKVEGRYEMMVSRCVHGGGLADSASLWGSLADRGGTLCARNSRRREEQRY